MAHLWVPWRQNHGQEKETGGPEWAIASLGDDAGVFALTDDPREPVRVRGKGRNGSAVAYIVRQECRQSDTWILQSHETERIRVNGLPLVAGIRVLEDRDEILTRETGRIFFSTERAPKVEPFPGREEPTPCPRCKGTIFKGELSVKCPKCRTWFHQRPDMGCWGYTDKCALCDQLTRLDACFRWTPESL